MKLLIRLSKTLILCAVLLAGNVRADWPCRFDGSVPVIVDSGSQWNVRVASDQNHGAIYVWQDRRDGVYDKLYAQHFNGAGTPLWKTGGVRLSLTSGYQYYPQIISDHSGGAFIVWQDNRTDLVTNYDIYIQRLDPQGNARWTPNGVPVCTSPGHQYNPQLASDGNGGVIIVWQGQDTSNGEFDIYAQRFDQNGTALWAANGTRVTNVPNDQIEPQLVGDGKGGAIVTWTDYRSTTTIADIYAQHLRASDGTGDWNGSGVAICIALDTQKYPQIVSDGAGGAIIAWQDRRNGSPDNIYAQRVDKAGTVQWTLNGVQAAPSTGLQYYPRAESDGNNGVIIVWQENRIGVEYDIYAQRIGPFGQRLWSSAGLAVCTAIGNQMNPAILVQSPSVLVSWQDFRNQNDYDIYAQRLNLNTGLAQWNVNGNPVAVFPNNQVVPQMASDSLSGAIIAWADFRDNNGTPDIQSQRIGANGMPGGGCFRTFSQDSLSVKSARYKAGYYRILGMPNTGIIRDSVFRNGAFPYNLVVGIKRTDSTRAYGWLNFTRGIFVRNALPQNVTPRPFDFFPSRRYLGRLTNPNKSRYNNRLVGEQIALRINIGASDLGMTQQQLGDLVFHDTIPGNPLNGLRLRAVANRIDSMLTYYKLYTGVDYSLICSSLHRINTAFEGPTDTISAIPLRIKPVRPLFSVPYLHPSADPPTILPRFEPAISEPDVPDEFVLSQNYPNPFNPVTTIEFILPEPAMVTLRVFNVIGQEVATPLSHQWMDDGQQSVQFDGSSLSSGVYFYQLLADPGSGGVPHIHVRKMMLLR